VDDTAEPDRSPTDRLVRVVGRASPPVAVAGIIAVVLTRGWPPEQVTAVLTLLVPVLILLLVFGFVGYPNRRP
jgi:Na+/H+-dicarboxylate symporter